MQRWDWRGDGLLCQIESAEESAIGLDVRWQEQWRQVDACSCNRGDGCEEAGVVECHAVSHHRAIGVASEEEEVGVAEGMAEGAEILHNAQ